MLRHIGIRPKCGLKYIEGKDLYHEIFPDGSYKVWTKKMLRSGCNKTIKVINKSLGLIYCPHCDELISETQFVEE